MGKIKMLRLVILTCLVAAISACASCGGANKGHSYSSHSYSSHSSHSSSCAPKPRPCPRPGPAPKVPDTCIPRSKIGACCERRAHIEELKKQIQSLTCFITKATDQLIQINAQIDNGKSQLKDTQNQIKKITKTIAKKQNALDKLKRKADKLRDEINAANGAGGAARRELEQLKQGLRLSPTISANWNSRPAASSRRSPTPRGSLMKPNAPTRDSSRKKRRPLPVPRNTRMRDVARPGSSADARRSSRLNSSVSTLCSPRNKPPPLKNSRPRLILWPPTSTSNSPLVPIDSTLNGRFAVVHAT